MAKFGVKQNMYSMAKKIIFDENLFYESWRFNSLNCKLSVGEKQQLIFLTQDQSMLLWKQEISKKYSHLMKIPSEKIKIIEKIVLDFEEPKSGEIFFLKKLPQVKTVVFFWGPKSACVASVKILIKSWTDFFCPSDENSIVSVPNFKQKIFSFEENFFAANFVF